MLLAGVGNENKRDIPRLRGLSLEEYTRFFNDSRSSPSISWEFHYLQPQKLAMRREGMAICESPNSRKLELYIAQFQLRKHAFKLMQSSATFRNVQVPTRMLLATLFYEESQRLCGALSLLLGDLPFEKFMPQTSRT